MSKRFEWYDRAQIDLGKYGKIAHMFAGEKLNLHRSEHPNTGYSDFSKGLLREIAKCLGITYEQFTGDYIGATYSSIRMGIADIWGLNLYRRACIPARLYQAALECWLEEDIEEGNTPFPGGVDAFLDQRQFVCRAEWRGPPQPTADDLKTAQAQQIQRQEGWVPTEQLAAQYGNDHRTVIESQARTNDLRKKHDLDPLPSKEGGAPGMKIDKDGKPIIPGKKPNGEDKPAEAEAKLRRGSMNGDIEFHGDQSEWWLDPCQRYQALRRAYMMMLSGQQTNQIRYVANGVEREVRYGNISMSELRKEMELARAECEGGPGTGRRFAVVGGARRQWGGGTWR